MKRLLCAILALLLLLGTVGCVKVKEEGQSTTATTVATTTSTTSNPEEKFMSETLFKDGETKFQIVYDGNDKVVASYVDAFVDFMLDEHNVDIYASDINKDDSVYEKQLIVGGASDIATPVIESMKNRSDFAIKVLEDAIVLCATNELSYDYLFGYFKKIVNLRGVRDLTLTSKDDLVYSQSIMSETTYLEYWKRETGKTAYDNDIINTVLERRENTFNGTTLPYRLYVPFDYTPDKEYPVLLFLHGAGERGSDGDKHVLSHNPIANFLNQKDSPMENAIIIAPQCPEGQKWVDMDWSTGSYRVDSTPESNEMKCVLDILDNICDEFSVDEKRVYVTGISMGGIGSWDLITRHSDIFAAAVPMCGTGDSTKGNILKNVPVWTVHSKDDPTVPFNGTKSVVDAIIAAGGDDVKFTELNGYKHNVWGWTTQNEEIYEWLFDQSK